MAGSGRIAVGVLVIFIAVIPTLDGSPGCFSVRPAPSVSYYWPAPYYYSYPRAVTVIPLEDSCEAAPTPPPPSQTLEPPLQPKQPKAVAAMKAPLISTTRSLGGTFTPGSKERCKVGFWNLTGRDVTLTVDGKSRSLPKNRSVTLDLEHQFTWQIEGPRSKPSACRMAMRRMKSSFASNKPLLLWYPQ